MKRIFRGVLLDLDGVITGTAGLHYRAWKKLGDGIGIPLDRSFNEQLEGASREDSLTFLPAHGKKEEQFSKTGLLKLTKRGDDYYLEMIQSVTPKDVFPGTLELLKDLRTNDIKILLISVSKSGPFLLAEMGLENYFDAIAGPAKVANRKPEPNIFLLAAEEIGLTPHDCIGVGDSKARITAIIASGAQPIGVGRSEDLREDAPIVSDIVSLTSDYLKKTWQPNV